MLFRFRRDTRGVTAILFALLLVPIIAFTGIAIDYGRALAARTKLVQAIDAAALAAGAFPNLDQEEIERQAQIFFDANYRGGGIGTPGPLSVTVDEGRSLSAPSAASTPPFSALSAFRRSMSAPRAKSRARTRRSRSRWYWTIPVR